MRTLLGAPHVDPSALDLALFFKHHDSRICSRFGGAAGAGSPRKAGAFTSTLRFCSVSRRLGRAGAAVDWLPCRHRLSVFIATGPEANWTAALWSPLCAATVRPKGDCPDDLRLSHAWQYALMQAIRSAQFEAASLIAAGARLGLCNCRGWTAADFARGQSVPRFLQLGLQGDPCECRRGASSLACIDGYVEVPFRSFIFLTFTHRLLRKTRRKRLPSPSKAPQWC